MTPGNSPVIACPFCGHPWPRLNDDGSYACLESSCAQYKLPFAVTTPEAVAHGLSSPPDVSASPE